MNPFLLEHGDLSAWYTLAFEGAPEPRIVIRSHPRVLDALLKKIGATSPLAFNHRKTGIFEGFVPPAPDGRWGFLYNDAKLSGQAFAPEADRWIAWGFPLPVIGLGKPKPDWNASWASAATLCVFFDALYECVRGVEASELGPARQLMRIETRLVDRDLHCAPIMACLSPETVRRLPGAMTPEALEDVTRAMRSAYGRLWGDRQTEDHAEFQTSFFPPEDIHLYVPMGNAVGLVPPVVGRLPGRGYALRSHNTDMPLHQLALLAGLARLHEHLERAH